jgi:geranyl-CoA carboxylase beta subunit
VPVHRSRIDPAAPAFAENRAAMLELVERLRTIEGRARETSARSAERFAKRGQLLPRERLDRVLDPGAPYLELANVAGYLTDTDDPDASVPGGSVLTGIGFIAGTRCVVVVNDSGIGAGAVTAAGGAKTLRAQAIARENRLPYVSLVESAGANLLEYRVEGWSAGGRFFANYAKLSAAGIPTVTVLHGSSTAGGAYMPGMSDVVIGVEGQGRAFLAGPPLLKAATGEIADAQDLGGVAMHATVSGLVEHVAQDDADGLRIAREVVDRLAWGRTWLPEPPAGFEEPAYDPDEIAGIVPIDYRRPYDVREVIARIADGSDLLEFKAGYGAPTICVEAAVHGHPVGFVANNGALDNAGATKATHFIQRCCQLGTPLVFLQNITGYMVGVEAERGGMIKHGSKMIQAVTTATVPRFTFLIGASFGAGNYGMCGQGYDPRLLFTWPNARGGVMGAQQAAGTMRVVAEDRAKRRGEPLDEAALDAFTQQIVALYEGQESAFVMSGRGMDDGMIDPRDTRKVLGFALATAAEAQAAAPRPVTFGVARP